jgi:hypothetical protein
MIALANFRPAICFLLMAASAASVAGQTLDTILAKMQQQRSSQRAKLCGYTVERTYTLHNPHLSHDAVMTFQVTMNRETGKHFRLISEQHAGLIVRHALLDIVEAEPKTLKQEQAGEIDTANYKFALLGETALEGKDCWVLKITPKHSSKFLIRGQIWVDAQAYAIVRVKGRISRSVSFWVGAPEIEQDWSDFGGIWMPTYATSFAHVKLAGETRVTIQFSNYQLRLCEIGQATLDSTSR